MFLFVRINFQINSFNQVFYNCRMNRPFFLLTLLGLLFVLSLQKIKTLNLHPLQGQSHSFKASLSPAQSSLMQMFQKKKESNLSLKNSEVNRQTSSSISYQNHLHQSQNMKTKKFLISSHQKYNPLIVNYSSLWIQNLKYNQFSNRLGNKIKKQNQFYPQRSLQKINQEKKKEQEAITSTEKIKIGHDKKHQAMLHQLKSRNKSKKKVKNTFGVESNGKSWKSKNNEANLPSFKNSSYNKFRLYKSGKGIDNSNVRHKQLKIKRNSDQYTVINVADFAKEQKSLFKSKFKQVHFKKKGLGKTNIAKIVADNANAKGVFQIQKQEKLSAILQQKVNPLKNTINQQLNKQFLQKELCSSNYQHLQINRELKDYTTKIIRLSKKIPKNQAINKDMTKVSLQNVEFRRIADRMNKKQWSVTQKSNAWLSDDNIVLYVSKQNNLVPVFQVEEGPNTKGNVEEINCLERPIQIIGLTAQKMPQINKHAQKMKLNSHHRATFSVKIQQLLFQLLPKVSDINGCLIAAKTIDFKNKQFEAKLFVGFKAAKWFATIIRVYIGKYGAKKQNFIQKLFNIKDKQWKAIKQIDVKAQKLYQNIKMNQQNTMQDRLI